MEIESGGERTLFESVLLIEDDPAHGHLIKRALRGYCREIVHCDSLGAALERLRSWAPSIIMTDLNLPDSKDVRKIGQLQKIRPETPTVVLTSSTSILDAVEAMQLGAKDYIVKDFGADFRQVLGLALSRVSAALVLETEKNRLQREMDALRIAIENSQDGLAVTDSTGLVAYSNSSFREFVKLCGGGCSLSALFSAAVEGGSSLEETLCEKWKTLTPGAVWHTEVKLVQDKGRAFDLSLSIIRSAAGRAPSAGTHNQGNECVVWVRDISEQKRREKFQREILSTTTHDLKGPLGAILLSTDLLTGFVKADQKSADLVVRVASSARSAINLIDEFLSARRIKEGTFILRPVEQSIGPIVGEVIENFAPTAEAKNIALSFGSPGEDLRWRVDKTGLSRVTGNLVSNALKFTPRSGRIQIRTELKGDEMHLIVSDSGCGMEPAEVQKIFERYARLDRHADIAGSGIGLFVVKSIVTAHGGKIEVTSRVGEGTVFDLAFPRNPPVNERGELISLDFA